MVSASPHGLRFYGFSNFPASTLQRLTMQIRNWGLHKLVWLTHDRKLVSSLQHLIRSVHQRIQIRMVLFTVPWKFWGRIHLLESHLWLHHSPPSFQGHNIRINYMLHGSQMQSAMVLHVRLSIELASMRCRWQDIKLAMARIFSSLISVTLPNLDLPGLSGCISWVLCARGVDCRSNNCLLAFRSCDNN